MNHRRLPKEFCIKFNHDLINIYYVGCIHTHVKNSKTFKNITKVIPLVRAVVVEGFAGVISDKTVTGVGEGAHAIRLAKANGIIAIGAETPIREFVKIIAKKYNDQDIQGWVFLVIARQSFDQGYTYDEMMSNYAEYSPWYVSLISVKNKIDPLKWFQNTFGKPYQYGKFLDHSSPKRGTMISRTIARDIASLREPLLIKKLYEVANKYKSVAYIIGRDHINRDMSTLLKTFGSFTIC